MAEQQMYNFVTISRFPGNPGTADGTNNAARFLNPSSMWLAMRTMYSSDTSNDAIINNTIRLLTRVGSNWITTTIAGVVGNLAQGAEPT